VIARWGAHLVVGLMWLLHWLPLPLLAAVGQGLGRLLWWTARSRRRVALTNLALCFPDQTEAQRRDLARAHFGWLARSILERSLLLFASEDRLRRMIRIEGDIGMSEREDRPVMWLMPHFVGLEFVGPTLMLFQGRPGVDVYQKQSNPVFDAALLKARTRLGHAILIDRAAGVRPVMRAIQAGAGFVNGADMDFGTKDAAFVPFFGVPASTLLSPARMARTLKLCIQPIVITMLPRGRGYVATVMTAPEGMDHPDPLQATLAFNRWLEARILEQPEQYLWVHRRFKTRPAGSAPVY
jgi:Kdo2-lipid IVA lauroyltransferase/acyltransferase